MAALLLQEAQTLRICRLQPGCLIQLMTTTVPSDATENDSFVAKFDAAGALEFLTYLGGSSSDHIHAVAVDEQCSIYLTGQTWSVISLQRKMLMTALLRVMDGIPL